MNLRPGTSQQERLRAPGAQVWTRADRFVSAFLQSLLTMIAWVVGGQWLALGLTLGHLVGALVLYVYEYGVRKGQSA